MDINMQVQLYLIIMVNETPDSEAATGKEPGNNAPPADGPRPDQGSGTSPEAELAMLRERVRALESELAKTVDIFEGIVETTDDGIMVENEQGRVSLVNSGLVRMLGYEDKSDVIDRPWTHFFSLESEKKVAGRPGVYESLLLTRDGRKIPILITSTSFSVQGRYMGVLSVIKDTTFQKQTEERLQALSRKVISLQEEERARLARELHDEIGQQMAAVQLIISGIKQQSEPRREHILMLADKIKNIPAELRRICKGLRPAALDSLGLISAVNEMTNEFVSVYGINIDVKIEEFDDKDLKPEISINVYRIIQEAISNAVRHSGATVITIAMKRAGNKVLLIIADDGGGFDPSQNRSGLGLDSMRERAALCGGTADVESEPGKGTEINVIIPL